MVFYVGEKMNFENIKKINIITGHYGSGKTNFAVNLAMYLAGKGETVRIVDLDIVNPYFRTADFKDLFNDNNIELSASVYANSNLDIPAITFDVERLAGENGYLIVDVGGDDDGAIALGRYYDAFKSLGENNDVEMLYVINKYRYLVDSPEEAVSLMREIESASRLRCTGIVNNSNLGAETTEDTILESVDFAESVSEMTGLNIKYTCVSDEFNISVPNPFNVKRYVKTIWES